MTITLDLPPETEAAAARGVPVSDYLLSLIETCWTPPMTKQTLDIALAGLLAEADALEIASPHPGLTGEFGAILTEKFRRQGLEL